MEFSAQGQQQLRSSVRKNHAGRKSKMGKIWKKWLSSGPGGQQAKGEPNSIGGGIVSTGVYPPGMPLLRVFFFFLFGFGPSLRLK
jgi:hypothetical protein